MVLESKAARRVANADGSPLRTGREDDRALRQGVRRAKRATSGPVRVAEMGRGRRPPESAAVVSGQKGVKALSEPAIWNSIALDAQALGPSRMRKMLRAEDAIDSGQMKGEVLVDRLGIGGVMKRMVARRDNDLFEQAETKAEVGMEKHAGDRDAHRVSADSGVAESSDEERRECHRTHHHDVDEMEPRAR